MTPVAEVQRVLSAHPGLGALGFGLPPPERVDLFAKQVDEACRWIATSEYAQRLVETRGVYVIKHAFEKAARELGMPTGAVICAAVLSGFEPVHGRYPGPNCRFIRASKHG